MKKILVGVFVILIVCGIGFLFLTSKVQNIECRDQFGICKFSLNVKKTNIFETKAKLEEVLKADKNVLQYRIDFEFPYNLKVYTIVREPIVAFSLPNGGFALISNDGQILETTKVTSLPKLVSYYNLDNDQIVFVANLMSDLNKIYNVDLGKVNADGLQIDNIKNRSVVFPLNGDIDVLLGSLNLVLSRLQGVSEASTIRTIDLRFKNPVLK